MFLPESALYCIRTLEKAGFEAYAVGGCVRDSLLGLTPHDYDLCTNATPSETAAIFDGFNSEVVGFEQYTNEVEIEFYETDDYADGMRLLGYPTAWQYGEEAPRLLMQIDHLDAGLGFLDHLDGYTYLALGDDVDGFSDVTLIQDYS